MTTSTELESYNLEIGLEVSLFPGCDHPIYKHIVESLGNISEYNDDDAE